MLDLVVRAAAPVAVILPVFGLILIGRLLIRFHFLDAAGTKGLTSVIFWVLLPALLFLSIVNNEASAGIGTVGLFFAVALTVFALSTLGGIFVLRLPIDQAAVFALNAAYGNTVLLGIPIVGAIWGAPGLTILLSIVAAHSLVMLPLATVLVEFAPGETRRPLATVLRDTVVASLRNPVIASILAAAIWRWLGLPVPGIVRRGLELLAQAAPALSLICLGASLPGLRRSSIAPPVLAAVAIKMVAMPLGMAGTAALAGIPMPAAGVLVLIAAMPTGANAFLLAHRSPAMMEASAATVVIATLVALVTLSLILAVL